MVGRVRPWGCSWLLGVGEGRRFCFYGGLLLGGGYVMYLGWWSVVMMVYESGCCLGGMEEGEGRGYGGRWC